MTRPSTALEVSRQMAIDGVKGADVSAIVSYEFDGELRSAFQRNEVGVQIYFESGKKMFAVLSD